MNDSNVQIIKEVIDGLSIHLIEFLPDFVIERDGFFYLNVKNLFEQQIS